MLFTFEVAIGALAYYFEIGHKILLVIGLIVIVLLFGVLRVVFVRRRARRGGR